MTRLWRQFWADLRWWNRRNVGKRKAAKSKGNVKHKSHY